MAWLTGYAATVRSCLAILVTLVACVACVACKDQGLERLHAVKDAVCACKSASCADQAIAQVENIHVASNPRSQAVAREIMDCRSRLEAAERPSTDPDAAGSGEPAAPAAGSADGSTAGSAAH